MNHLVYPLRKLRLRWRLTLSYMMVTVAAGIFLQFAFIAFFSFVLLHAPEIPAQIAQTLQRAAPGAAPFLSSRPVDRGGLDRWLHREIGHTDGNNGIPLAYLMGRDSTLAVVNPEGIILSSTSTAHLPVGTSIFAHVQPEDANVIQSALSGGTDPGASSHETDGRVVAAAPILGNDGRVLGALYLVPDVQAMQTNVILLLSLSLLPALGAWTIFSGIVGLVFGLMTSRGLTRRLRVLTHAADAWSKGDFVVRARDASTDELGELARDLNRMAEHLQSLMHDRQQLAVVDERNRLARDLHDSVKQQVFATSMQVAAARALVERDPQAAQQRLEQAEHLVGQAQQELNNLIGELRPAALGDKGLAPALRELAADWSHANNIVAEVRVTGEQRAALDVEQALYRVAQEALSNVARHSNATTVEMRLAWEHDMLTLAIEDNGRGFDVAQHGNGSTGIGLRSMRERVEALGGTFYVYGLQSGTRIEAHVPVTSAPPPPSASSLRDVREVSVEGGVV